jgi:hypothetical protein
MSAERTERTLAIAAAAVVMLKKALIIASVLVDHSCNLWYKWFDTDFLHYCDVFHIGLVTNSHLLYFIFLNLVVQ